VELRRALLLFAIVLGLAAVAASVSRPPAEEGTDTAAETPPEERSTPTAGPAPGPGPPAEIAFEADLQPETRTVPARRAATVTITAYEPGQVEIERLGLSAPAEPNGPARFDLLTGSPETYAVTFTPVETGERRKIGVIEVEG
jgi:hypothetical protein